MDTAMHLPVTLLYAAVLGLLFVVLTFNVLRWRVNSIVDPTRYDSAKADRVARVQGNFSESVPLALILIAGLELNGAPALLLHGLGILLVVARLSHAIGMTRKPLISVGRILGIQATLMMLLVASIAALFMAFNWEI